MVFSNWKLFQSKFVIYSEILSRIKLDSSMKCFFSPVRRSVVVGAGYIAVEMAGILSTLGSKTSLIIRQTGVRIGFNCNLNIQMSFSNLCGREVSVMCHYCLCRF